MMCLHRRLSWRLETICLSLTQERTTLEMKVSSLGLPPRLLIFSDYRSIFKEMSLLKYVFNGMSLLK